jgi:hypothetical protein
LQPTGAVWFAGDHIRASPAAAELGVCHRKGSFMRVNAFCLCLGLVVTALSVFGIWFCAALATVKMNSDGLGVYVWNMIHVACASMQFALILILNVVGFVVGFWLFVSAFVGNRTRHSPHEKGFP